MEGTRNEDFFSYMLAQVLSVRVFLVISRVWHQLEKEKIGHFIQLQKCKEEFCFSYATCSTELI